MKTIAYTLLLVGVMSVSFASDAYAEGGKVRGEVGQGAVVQVTEVPAQG